MGPDLFVILASKRSYRCHSRKLRTVSEGLRNSNAFMHRPLRVASRYSRNPHRGFTNTTYRYCSIAIRNTGLYLLDKRSGGRQEPKGDSGQYVKKEGMLAIGAGATLVSLTGCLSDIALDQANRPATPVEEFHVVVPLLKR